MIDSSRSYNEHITSAPRSTIYVTFLQLVGLLAIHIGVHAEPIYQWQDAQGVPHFSDRPRRDGFSNRLGPARSFSDLARQQLNPELGIEVREADQSAIPENESARVPVRPDSAVPLIEPPIQRVVMAPVTGTELTKRCAQAYRTLGVLKRRPRATVQADDGRLVTLSRDEKATYIENLEADIAAHCKG